MAKTELLKNDATKLFLVCPIIIWVIKLKPEFGESGTFENFENLTITEVGKNERVSPLMNFVFAKFQQNLGID